MPDTTNRPTPEQIAGAMSTPLVEAKKYTQVTPTGATVRIVELVQAGESVSVVRACHGPIAGTQYEVPNSALVAR